MVISWMDTLGPDEVAGLANEWAVTLTPALVQFLERFGDRVSAATRQRSAGARRAARARHELDAVPAVVADELRALRAALPPRARADVADLRAHRHVETRLPVVVLRLRALPALVVHVNREYAVRRRGLTCGFRAREYCGARLTGPVARAANYLRQAAAESEWMLSVTELLEIWINAALEIPIKDRMEASRNPSAPEHIRRAPARRDHSRQERSASRHSPQKPVELGVLFPKNDADEDSLHQAKRRRRDVLPSPGPLKATPASRTLSATAKRNLPDSNLSIAEARALIRRRKSEGSPSSEAAREVTRKKSKPAYADVDKVSRVVVKRPRSASTPSETSPSASHDSRQSGRTKTDSAATVVRREAGNQGARKGQKQNNSAMPPSMNAARDVTSQVNSTGSNPKKPKSLEQSTGDRNSSAQQRPDRGQKKAHPSSEAHIKSAVTTPAETGSCAEEVLATGGGPVAYPEHYGYVPQDGAMDRSEQETGDFTFHFGDPQVCAMPSHTEEVIATGGGDVSAMYRDSFEAEQSWAGNNAKLAAASGQGLSVDLHAAPNRVSHVEVLASGGGAPAPVAPEADNANGGAGPQVHEEVLCRGGW